MKSVSFSKQALPLAKARFPRCANIGIHFEQKGFFDVERNVASGIEFSVDTNRHRSVERIVAFEIFVNVDYAKSARVLNVASSVASPLHSLFIKLLPLQLPIL